MRNTARRAIVVAALSSLYGVGACGANGPQPTAESSTESSSVPTATTTRTTSASSVPVPSATTSAPTARPALSTRSVLVAGDYRAAGWVVGSVQASRGWGQSPIATCQQDIPAAGTTLTPFRGDGYATVSGRKLATYQYAMDLGRVAAAEDMVTAILGWRTRCPDLMEERRRENLALGGVDLGTTVDTSSAPQRLRLHDGAEGYSYTTSFKHADGTRYEELLLVARTADRLSLVALHEREPAGSIASVDVVALLTRSIERLG